VPLTKWAKEKAKVASASFGLQTSTQNLCCSTWMIITTFKAYYVTKKEYEQAIAKLQKTMQFP
jgi:hypothetical protein